MDTGADAVSNEVDKAAAEETWRIYDVVNEWVRFADAKAAVTLTADVVLAGAAIDVLKGNLGFIDDARFTGWVVALLVLAGIGLLKSVLFCLWCLAPRTGAGAPTSLIFFSHIARRELTKFRSEARTLSRPDVVFDQISEQVWLVSKVADRKHGLVRWSIITLGGSLLAGLAAGIVVLF